MSTLILENKRARLTQLAPGHYEDLLPIALSVDIHTYGPSDIATPAKFGAYFDTAIGEGKAGVSLPFIIYDKATQAVAGCTRFGLINHTYKTAHIGWTWLSQEHRGTGLNKEVKHLMLDYAFDILAMETISFRIDALNVRSRKAVEKLGAHFEGILRSQVIVKNNRRRDTACYSILRSEWKKSKNPS